MISVRLDQIHRALQRITGGRHARRPCFDFGTPIRGFRFLRSDLSSNSRLCDGAYSVDKDLRRITFSNSHFFFKDTVINKITKKSIVMALNKLSIDKVDLTDKRVLVRYVFHDNILF